MSDAATKVGADKVAQQIDPLHSNQSDKGIFHEASSTKSERILDDFPTDESVSKFVKGETIIDKENPFKSLDEDDLIDTVNYFKSGAYKQNNCDINVQKRIFNPTYRNIRIPLENNGALKIEPYNMSEPTPTERSIRDVPESIHDSMNSIGLSDVSDVETVSSGDFVYFPSAVLDAKKNNLENSSAHSTEVSKSDAIPVDKTKKKNGGFRKIFPGLFSHSSKGKFDSIEKNQTGKKYENDSKQILKLNNSLEEKQSILPNKQLCFTRNSNHTDIIQTSYETAKQPIAERENDIIVSMKDLPKTVKPKPPIRQASLREDARKFEVEIRRKDALTKNGKTPLKSGRASVPLTKKESEFIAWTNPLDNLNKNTQVNNTKLFFNKQGAILNDDINFKKKAPKAPPRSFAHVKKDSPVGDDDVFFHTVDNEHGERIDASHNSTLASDIKSVGAQMKISTTNVMLSPKKEAEVRLRKEMRARSISPVQNTEIQCGDDFVFDNKIPEKVYSPPDSPKISGQQSNTKGTPTSSQHDNMANLRAYYLNHKNRVEMQKNSVDSLSDVEYSKVQELKATSLCSANNNSKDPHSPQKMKNLQNVEAFYWQQIRQMKMKQEQEFIEQALQNSNISLEVTTNKNDFFQPDMDRRSRSVSPGFRGNERRSLSLPRGHDLYSRVIGKGALKAAAVDNKIYQNFNRSDALRQTVDYVDPRIQPEFKDVEFRKPHVQSRTVHLRSESVLDDMITRNSDLTINGAKVEVKLTPIFKRGSLISSSQDESPSREKRVSFSSKNTADNLYENYSGRQSLYEGATVPENTYGKIMKPDRGRMVNDDIALNGKIVFRRDIGVDDKVEIGAQQVPIPVSRGTAASTARNLLSRRVLSSPFPKASSEDWPKDDSASETSELKRILRAVTKRRALLHESVSDSGGSDSARIPGVDIRSAGSGSRAGRQARRDDPRRHTLGGDHLYQSQQQTPLQAQQQGVMRTMDLQNGIVWAPGYNHPNQRRPLPVRSALPPTKPPLPRGYPPSSAMLFDDDPGIMSEVETASTGFRRGGKQRSSLPVVRTPSKTLERPLGLVFLQYRNETKRALLPNEITSIDTVKALFVRSFPKQLTMEYLDSPLVKIYIHDSSKDMFYELEDLRSHLRDIRDRSVLRLFESADVSGGAFPGSLGAVSGVAPAPVSGPPSWDQDQSYFSEPEFDSDYHHQHIHKSKVNNAKAAPAYYMGSSVPTTLPRGTPVMRAYSPASGHPIPADRMKSLPATAGAPPKPLRAYGGPVAGIRGGSERCFPFTAPSVDAIRGADQLYSLPADRIHNDGYMSSPERSSRGPYEEPYYTQYVGPQPRGGMTPVIDEESSDGALLEDQYGLYGVKIPPGSRANRAPGYETARLNSHATNDELAQRIRVEHMERQLANLTGLVAKALQAPVVSGPGVTPPLGGEYAGYGVRNSTSAQDKSVSFEKSVSFSDEPPDMNSPKQHSPQHSERDRLKPAPPPKPAALIGPQLSLTGSQMIPMGMPMDMYTQLKILHKKCKDLRMEMRNLRRMTLAQVHTMREMICDTFVKIRSLTNNGGDMCFSEESLRLAREEEAYKQVMLKLESDLTDLESTVERLRGNVINRKTRVNMVDVEKMALVLSKSSKTVADLKLRFPILQDGMKGLMSNEMEKVVRDEKFLKEEPERLEIVLKRCKKLTGTLVTLKRLASVQEQRLPCAEDLEGAGTDGQDLDGSHDMTAASTQTQNKAMGGGLAAISVGGDSLSDSQRPENALDALLDELQTFARPGSQEGGSFRRLHSEISNLPPVRPRGQSSTNKPPVPERHPELLVLAARRPPPPPPPRTTSRSPLASPLTSPASPASLANHRHHASSHASALNPIQSASNSSSCESVNSQEGVARSKGNNSRHELLEQRHQELLKKQKALQEQYARLQMIQKGNNLTDCDKPDLKKTGSESNLLHKMGMNMVQAASGSLTHLASVQVKKPFEQTSPTTEDQSAFSKEENAPTSTVNKIYETDIL